ncbi:hypothetical protein FB45DRAFT_902223 [Roridomyces roridus]|uniref:MYND-type domain-containing protein n=1 Tax=Roridomyces roridus TaxID=1738132 RepID=A0AAD7FU18_9AGAR|nr:hypothetical protein FB45DRAFT_902223 [Roridomyces roridus]
MPKKKKSPEKTHAGSTLSTFTELLAAALVAQPDTLIEHISRFLGVADVCTARGLKQCHDAFDTVSSKLDALYAQTREFRPDCASADRLSSISADRLAAAIILTYSRIAVDAKLGKRIFVETEFLSKAMTLFSSPDLSVGGTLMKALQNITAQLDIVIVTEMLPVLPTILDYCETNRERLRDPWMDDGVYVLTRCAAGVFLENPDRELVAQVPLPRILRFSLSVIHLPNSSSFAVRHFAFFCCKMNEHIGTVLLSNSDLIDFLVAAMRSRDLPTRCLAQNALIQLYATNPQDEIKTVRCEPDLAHPGSKSFLEQVGDEINQLYDLVHAFDLVDALDEKAPESHSGFGYVFSDWIQRNSPLARGRLDKGRDRDIHLTKILETCEAALRRDESARADLAADIIRTDLLLAHEKDEASSFAQSCVEKHPSVAYFYYAVSLSPNSVVPAVLFAEKGLQCRPMSDFIRLELLYWATTGVYHMIMAMLTSSPLSPNKEHLHKAHVFLEKGLSHVNALLDSTPVQHPRAAEAGAMFALLTFLSKGHALTNEELQTMRGKFSTACEFRLSKDYTAFEEIFRRMPTAWQRWEAAMSREPEVWLPSPSSAENQSSVPDTAADANQDDIVEWLQKLNVSPQDLVSSEMIGEKFGAKRDCGEVLLHACTFCGKRSAVLKRCSGCQRARSDWKNHRQICKASRVA